MCWKLGFGRRNQEARFWMDAVRCSQSHLWNTASLTCLLQTQDVWGQSWMGEGPIR